MLLCQQPPLAFSLRVNITAHHVDRSKPYPPWLKVRRPPLMPLPISTAAPTALLWWFAALPS